MCAVTAAVLLAASAPLFYVSAAFHADGEHGGTTLHGEIHQTAGIITFVLLVIAMFVSWRAFRRDGRWTPLTRPTFVCAITALAAFLATPTAPDTDFGIVQRIFLATCFGWMIAVAWRVRTLAAADRSPAVGKGARRPLEAPRRGDLLGADRAAFRLRSRPGR